MDTISCMNRLLLPGLLVTAAFAQPRKDLTLHATFDKGIDADFALGDARLYTATSYRNRSDAKPGLHNPNVTLAPGQGLGGGGALRFSKKNTQAIYYQGEKNVAFNPQGWSGTISFWLSLDPETDLEAGFCDPIQVTAEAYNDAAIWVDFTRDDKPRHFRLGVFGDLKAWNPKNLEADKNPDFNARLVVVRKTPFARGQWTHVAITHDGLGGGKGAARLYLSGQLQGVTPAIAESFHWDLSRGAVRLGVNYVGLLDEVSLYNRPLTDQQVRALSVPRP